MKKQAHSSCEYSGEEVAQNDSLCKKWGGFFFVVRCPSWGTSGSAHSFINGCPSCGYAEKQNNSKTDSNLKKDFNYVSDIQTGKNHFYLHKNKAKAKKSVNTKNNFSLPVWIYCLTFLLLVVMIILFMRCSY